MRENGATPATIAVLAGHINIGELLDVAINTVVLADD